MKLIHVTRRGAIAIGAGVLGVAIVGFALRPASVEVDVGGVTRGPMRVTVDDDGRTRVRDRFVITAPATGWLERIELREGADVSRGQIVAWLAPVPLDSLARGQAAGRLIAAEALAREAALRVEQARTAYEQSQRALRRSEALLAAGAISPASRETAADDERTRANELTAAQARARAASADIDVERAVLAPPSEGRVAVRSPIRGRLLRVHESSARTVPAGTPLLEVGDPTALEVIVDVLSTDAVRIAAGDSVEIVDWGGDRSLTARVRRVEPSAYTRVSALGVEEQRANVLIDLPSPPPELGDGFRVEVRTTIWSAANVLAVPSSALFQHDGAWSVFMVEEGRARRRAVHVGHRTSAVAEVISGLTAGETVILFPSDQIADGTRARPRVP